MKLGITYMIFDGEELLEFAIKSIRSVIDHISVTYQNKSYFGNLNDSNLFDKLTHLKSIGLIDELIYFEPNLTISPKENELQLRNIGLEASKKAGCTHHISSDVDEFYKSDQLQYVKDIMDKENYDSSIAVQEYYYKDPTFMVYPSQNLVVSFMHPVSNCYSIKSKFPFSIEPTRKLINFDNCKVFTKDEFLIHHMSYVRKDIRKKFKNSDNGRFYKIEKFMANFENYKVGNRVCLLPDFLNRKTIQTENVFNIKI